MEVINDYNVYLSKIEKGEIQCICYGELSVLKVFANEKYWAQLKEGQSFYVWDNFFNDGQTILLKVEYKYNRDLLRIVESLCIKENIKNISNGLDINDFDAAMKWWGLCYYRDQYGKVNYDSYYDSCYVANESEIKMSDLQAVISQWIDKLFEGVEGLIYVLGDLADCNPVIYQLQQRGLEVKTLPIDNSDSVSDDNDRLLQLRDRLALPYCDSNLINVCFIAPDGINNCPAECNRSYLITIPIDLIDIEDKAIGDFTYKDILSNGKFCRDYFCCGHNYSYVEMELFADLHGNTVLKTTNSKAESRYTIINKFNYTNLQKDGQSRQSN